MKHLYNPLATKFGPITIVPFVASLGTPRRCLGFVRALTTIRACNCRGWFCTACQACHSLDYIPMNSPFPDAALWDRITKMIKAYGAPIDDTDAKAIAEYLKKNYGS